MARLMLENEDWVTGPADLDRQLDNFVARVPHVSYAVAVSTDGLLLGRNSTLPQDAADRLAAIAAGLVSLLNGAARSMQAEPVAYNLTEMRDGFMFSMAVPSGASLLVVAGRGCDIGRVGQELADLLNRIGNALNPPARNGAVSSPGLDR